MVLPDKTGNELERRIVNLLGNCPDIRLAFMFGSLEQGRARPDSDLDIGMAASAPLKSEEKKSMIERLAQLSGRPVDLIDLRIAPEPIFSQILTTGRLIHCTDRHLYAELIKRMLYDQADFMPYRRRILAERRKAWINS